MASRQDLVPAEPKIQAFLTHLAVDRDSAAATQNLAMNALVFLYKRVLNLPLTGAIDAVRVRLPLRHGSYNVPARHPRRRCTTRRSAPSSDGRGFVRASHPYRTFDENIVAIGQKRAGKKLNLEILTNYGL